MRPSKFEISVEKSLHVTEEQRILRDLLKRFTYRPGWEFKIEDGLLVVMAEVVDANDHSKLTPFIFRQSIPKYLHQDFDWTRWLFEQIRMIEYHEIEEFFRIDGKPVYDPHPELRIDDVQV